MKVNKTINLKLIVSLLFVFAVSLNSFEANAATKKDEKVKRDRKDRRVVEEKWPRVRREDDRTRKEDDRTRKERNKRMEKWPRTRKPRDTKKPKKSIPLDGGLGILVLGAAAFGARKLRNKN
jgi:TPP-dependent indolepyruvate ferredoxin oxidoreductase alpha subunit